MNKRPTYEELVHRVKELEVLERTVEERTSESTSAIVQLKKEIEERKRVEKTLRESEERYRSLFHNNPIETITVDNKASVTGYNLARARSGDKLPNIGDVMYKDYAAKHEIDMHNELMECIKSGESKTFREQKYKDKYLDIHMSPFPEGAIITSTDMTERKLAGLALSTLNDISQTVNQSLDLDKVLNDTLEKVIELFGLHSSTIRLIDEKTQELVVSAHKGFTSEDLKQLIIRRKLGEGSAAKPILSGEVIVVEDNLKDPRFTNRQGFSKRIGCRSFASIPLRSKNKILGTMSINSLEPRSYTDKEIQLFTSIGYQVGVAVENARLFSEVRQTTKDLRTLSAISETVNQSLNLEKILNDTLEKIIELFGLYSSIIRLIDEDTQELVVFAHRGLTSEDLKKLTMRRKKGEGTLSILIQSGEVLVVEDNLKDPRFKKRQGFLKRIGCRSLVSIPLKSKNKILGTMTIHSREPRSYTDKEIQLFTSIGHQVGIAIENARLYQDKELTIIELKETQGRLQQAQKMEAIGTLAGGIAHDFNNILSPIMIHSELAMMDLAPHNPIQHNLKEIFKAGDRAREMVKQILTFSRKEEGKKAEIKIIPIIRESLKLLRSTIPTTIDIHQNLEAESDTVLADPTQIHQIMLNLGTNAAHAMREKGGTMEVSLVQEDLDSEDISQYSDLSPGPYLRLTVSDTGSGIDDVTIQKIFEPYFTTKEPGEGTGMGLAVIHGIIKGYGGDIIVESEQGKGTSFSVYMPSIEADVSPVEKRETVLLGGAERVLLVDDEKGAVDAVQPMLEHLGYKVTARTSSIEALEAFRHNADAFDLVITDMTMPNMTGRDLAKELISIRSNIPIILCSGFSEQLDERKAKEIGISAFVMKPIIIREIAYTIRVVLDKE